LKKTRLSQFTAKNGTSTWEEETSSAEEEHRSILLIKVKGKHQIAPGYVSVGWIVIIGRFSDLIASQSLAQSQSVTNYWEVFLSHYDSMIMLPSIGPIMDNNKPAFNSDILYL